MWRFIICELVSGKVLDELPMRFTGSASRLLQNVGTGTLELPTRDPGCPETWENLVLPWRSLILAVDDTDRIVWHGIPTRRERTLSSVVSYPCVTVEGYLSRRYTPSMAFTATDQLALARRLITEANTQGINILTDTQISGIARDRTWYADEKVRILEALQKLSYVGNGFEWTIDVEWTDHNHTGVRKVFRTGYPVLGVSTRTPAHVFEIPGSITDLTFEESWGEAATHVQALGDSTEDITLVSAPVIDTVREQEGWPRLEESESFDGVSRQSTIDGHAKAMAATLFGGIDTVTFTARTDGDPALGDLTLGDSARIQANLPHLTLDAVWRVVGWELTPDQGTYKPTLARMT